MLTKANLVEANPTVLGYSYIVAPDLRLCPHNHWQRGTPIKPAHSNLQHSTGAQTRELLVLISRLDALLRLSSQSVSAAALIHHVAAGG